jgi:hypothetical protein
MRASGRREQEVMNDSSKTLYLDRGVLLNLCATGHAVEILRALSYQCAVLDDIYPSPLFLWTQSHGGEELLECQEIAIAPLVSAGVLSVEHFEREQYKQAFVAFALHIPDRQAALLALAEQSDAALALDDKCTRRVLHRLAPHQPVISTLTCLYTWQVSAEIPDVDMRSIVRDVAQRAQFTPPDDDPLCGWWQGIVHRTI